MRRFKIVNGKGETVVSYNGAIFSISSPYKYISLEKYDDLDYINIEEVRELENAKQLLLSRLCDYIQKEKRLDTNYILEIVKAIKRCD